MQSDRTSLSDIARILQLVATLPNLRPDPADEFGKSVFAGGSVRYATGSTHYEFPDGTKAFSNTLPFLNLTIVFPDGTEVKISNETPDGRFY